MSEYRRSKGTEPRIIGPNVVKLANGVQAKVPTSDVRFIAWLIDTVFVLTAAVFVQRLFWGNPPASLEGFRDFWLLDQTISFALFFSVIQFLYDCLLHRLWGTTLGKRSSGACLVSAASGARVTWRQAIGRSILRLPLGVTLLGDPAHQGLHDYLADTIVIFRKHSEE